MNAVELLEKEYQRVRSLSTQLTQQGLIARGLYRKGEADRLETILNLLKNTREVEDKLARLKVLANTFKAYSGGRL